MIEIAHAKIASLVEQLKTSSALQSASVANEILEAVEHFRKEQDASSKVQDFRTHQVSIEETQKYLEKIQGQQEQLQAATASLKQLTTADDVRAQQALVQAVSQQLQEVLEKTERLHQQQEQLSALVTQMQRRIESGK